MSAGRLLVMAGGTGGHVYPALALARCLADRGWQVDWVGTERGIEARLVPASGFALHTLSVLGIRGKGLTARLRGMVSVLAAGVQALGLVHRLHPDVVVGMGGYVAGPAGIAAVLLRKPLVLHEQNAVTGTTNRLLAPLAQRLLGGLPGAFAKRKAATWVGNPVRPDIAAVHFADRFADALSDADRPLQLLVLGGSLGATPLNEGVPPALAAFLAEHPGASVRVRHQCGARHEDSTRAAWDAVGLEADVSVFIDDMAAAYAWADLVICRAGALTVSELAATGTPAILVPLPHAIDDHQTANARVLSGAGAALLVPQSEFNTGGLTEAMVQLLATPGRLAAMSAAARRQAQLNATETVADIVEEVAGAR